MFTLHSGKGGKKIIRAKSVDIETICLPCVFSSNSLPSRSPPRRLYLIQSYTIQLIYWNLHERSIPVIFPVISFIHYFLWSWESRAVYLKQSHGYVTMLALKTYCRKLGQDAFINAKSCNKCSHLLSSLHESVSNFIYITIANNYINISLDSLQRTIANQIYKGYWRKIVLSMKILCFCGLVIRNRTS